jgi:hypothetical protein
VENRRCIPTAVGVAHTSTLGSRAPAGQAATSVVRDTLKLARVDILTDVIAISRVKSEMGPDRATMGGDVGALNRHDETFIWPDRVYGVVMRLFGGNDRVDTLPEQLTGEHDRAHVTFAGPVGMLAAAVGGLWWFVVAMCWCGSEVRSTR